MKTFLSVLVFSALAMSSLGQTQGVSQRATNGVAFGDTIVQTHIRATNTASTNTFAGKFQQGSSTAVGTGSSSFGLGTVSSASYAFGTGIRNQNAGTGAFVSGLSNTVFSGGSGSIVSGNNNSASGQYEFVSGANNVVDGSNTFVAGFGIAMDTLAHNGFFAGQNISVLSGASNNFAWNGDPATPLTIPDTRTNAFTVQAPGGIFLNGVQFTNGGGPSAGLTGMKTNQFTTNDVGVPIVGNVNLGGATNNASGDFGVNGTLGTGTANAGTLAVSGNASVNGTLSSSTSTSGVFTVTGSIVATITNQYPYFDENGVLRGTNNGAGFTNVSSGTVYASNIVSGGSIPVGALATNTAATAGNELLQITGDKRRWNSNVVIGGNLTVQGIMGGISNAAVSGTNLIVNNLKTVIQNGSANTLSVTNGNVGIGTAVPGQRLTIHAGGTTETVSIQAAVRTGASNVLHSYFCLVDGVASPVKGDVFTGLEISAIQPDYAANKNLRFIVGRTNGPIEMIRISGVNSNVGIGTTGPLNKLDVAGAVVIGGTAAGSVTAPANGLQVQGIIIGQASAGFTNGVASYSSITPVAIAATGWTNIWSTNNAVVVFDGTTCFYTNYLRSGVAWYTNVAALGHDRVSLQPGEGVAINGTGVTGVAKPF